MRTNLILPVGILALVLTAGCSTPYQSSGFSGGYSHTQLAPDVFRVRFGGNGYTSAARSQDYAMLRAADLCLEKGFKYLAVMDESTSTQMSSFTTGGGSAHTTGSGSISSYGNRSSVNYSEHTTYSEPQTYNVYKPSSGLLIRCFPDKPADCFAYDAAFLQQSLRTQYKIKPQPEDNGLGRSFVPPAAYKESSSSHAARDAVSEHTSSPQEQPVAGASASSIHESESDGTPISSHEPVRAAVSPVAEPEPVEAPVVKKEPSRLAPKPAAEDPFAKYNKALEQVDKKSMTR